MYEWMYGCADGYELNLIQGTAWHCAVQNKKKKDYKCRIKTGEINCKKRH
jgi:hypothetical protein